jgi:hypothetical protein
VTAKRLGFSGQIQVPNPNEFVGMCEGNLMAIGRKRGADDGWSFASEFGD